MASEMADDFRAMHEASKVKRAGNREFSTNLLTEQGVGFVSKNDGAHLIVEYSGRVVDFWPGTGKYKFRDSDKYKRGVFNMLKELGV